MTKTPHGPGSHEACSAYVSYKGTEQACKRAGSHPDPDGKRFWCGLHLPETREKRAKQKIERQAQVETKAKTAAVVAVENTTKAGMVDEIIAALKDAQSSLIEISNMKDTGWPEGTGVEKYRALLSHQNMVASNAHEKAGGMVRKVDAEIGRANRAKEAALKA